MGNAINALFYLRVMSFKNAVISRVLRLKQPKYLIGAVVGVAYVFFVVFPRSRGNQTGGADVAALTDAFPIERLPVIAALGALVLMVIVALYWLLPRERAALAFSEAEIAFLFPAPIGRRTLIHYRWINAQLRILFTSLILTLVSSGWSFVPGDAWIRLLGWWLLLSTVDLHGVGSSFAITRLLDRGVTSLHR
ncbi:MAG TPA: putative ABC exporter domain-containing protein, partial [Gammaproteobacteria bacterium]|nr:putative ABC exporter domain-containing protein [Gammaproteobacteria bacterium]